jgi:hypothetical protein
MNPFKPSTWFSKPAPTGVYVLVKMDGPFGAISDKAPPTTDGPYVHFRDMDLAKAAAEIPGKGFYWHILPMWVRERLEMDPWHVVTEWNKMKEWVR